MRKTKRKRILLSAYFVDRGCYFFYFLFFFDENCAEKKTQFLLVNDAVYKNRIVPTNFWICGFVAGV